MLEVKNQAMSLYESMEEEKARFGVKEKESKDRSNKMGIEWEAKSTFELRLMDDNEALKIWGDKACQRAIAEKKRVDNEQARAEEERARADEATKKVVEAIKRAEEVEVKGD